MKESRAFAVMWSNHILAFGLCALVMFAALGTSPSENHFSLPDTTTTATASVNPANLGVEALTGDQADGQVVGMRLVAVQILCVHPVPPRLRLVTTFKDTSKIGSWVYWRYCWHSNDGDPKHGWARPDRLLTVANHFGSGTESCSVAKGDWFKGWAYSIRIWQPYTGLWHQSRRHVIPCGRDRTGSSILSLKDWPQYRYAGGINPRVKMVYIEQWWGFVRKDQLHNRYGRLKHPGT